MREPGLESLHHLRRQRKRPGPGILLKEETQEVEEGGIRSRHISRKAVPLDRQNVVGGRVGCCLSNQSRFANASIARNQGHTSLPLPCLIDKEMKGGQIVRTANQGRTRKSKYLHSIGSRLRTGDVLCLLSPTPRQPSARLSPESFYPFSPPTTFQVVSPIAQR